MAASKRELTVRAHLESHHVFKTVPTLGELRYFFRVIRDELARYELWPVSTIIVENDRLCTNPMIKAQLMVLRVTSPATSRRHRRWDFFIRSYTQSNLSTRHSTSGKREIAPSLSLSSVRPYHYSCPRLLKRTIFSSFTQHWGTYAAGTCTHNLPYSPLLWCVTELRHLTASLA